MTYLIRDAAPADAAEIVAIIREMAEEDREATPVDAEYVRQYLAAAGSGILLAEADGAPAGLLSYSFRPGLFHAAPSCLIELLIVRRDRRGCGIGGALLEALLSRAREARCAEASVSTMPGNPGAIRFYRSHGLTEEAVFLERHFPVQ